MHKNPTTIVIFGGTGDLSKRRLIPALFDLYLYGALPKAFRVVGFAHTRLDREGFRDFVRSALTSHNHDTQKISSFSEHVFYVRGSFDDKKQYARLSDFLLELDADLGQCANKLLYIAASPSLYEVLFQNIAASSLARSCSDDTGWTRILVEKPFGRDSDTAQQLDKMLGSLFAENQIFRIDHYLAKETVQNILTFRFSNILFEPIWNSKYIEKVHISLMEKRGVGARRDLYADLGALRDVGQNHIMQMLALVAMENPQEFRSETIREERARVLAFLKPLTKKQVAERVVRGRYADFGADAETYFHVQAHIHNKRWRGVPFYLESGKGVAESKVEIAVYFKKTERCLCPPEAEQHHQNILTFRVQPDAGISLVFWAKNPDLKLKLEPRTLAFTYRGSKEDARIPDAYEKVLFDSISGDQTLFPSTEEVRAAWKFITSITAHWDGIPMIEYTQGTTPDIKQ